MKRPNECMWSIKCRNLKSKNSEFGKSGPTWRKKKLFGFHCCDLVVKVEMKQENN